MLFQRIRQTFAASVDHFVDGIENHDAVTEAYLKRLQGDVRTMQVRMSRLAREREQLEKRREHLESMSLTWKQRAMREENEDRALECLRRAKSSESERAEIEKQQAEFLSLEQQLNRDLGSLRGEVATLKGKRQALKAREARAQALEGFQRMDEHLSEGVDRCLEKWEDRLLERELSADRLCPDAFEEDINSREEREHLLLELQALKEEGVES